MTDQLLTPTELLAQIASVPTGPGVYRVTWTGDDPPEINSTTPCRRRAGQPDPTYSVDELHGRWIEGASVIYIGKATNLRRRLRQYLRDGLGLATSHRGGRAIWQLADREALRFSWQETPGREPVDVERELIEQFMRRHHGRIPFANRTQGTRRGD